MANLNDIYKIDAIFLQDGKEWMIGEYYRVSIEDLTKTPADIAIGAVTQWKIDFFTTGIDQLISASVKLTATIAQKIFPTIDFAAEKPWIAVNGFGGNPPLPAQVCGLMHQTGTIAGRSFQGRVYLSGMPAIFETDGVMNTIGETFWMSVGVAAFGANTMIPIGGSPLQLTHTNFSRKRANAVPPVAPFWSDIQSAFVNPSLATQRPRAIQTVDFSTP